MVFLISCLVAVSLGGVIYLVIDSTVGKTAIEKKRYKERIQNTESISSGGGISIEKTTFLGTLYLLNDSFQESEVIKRIALLLKMSGTKMSVARFFFLMTFGTLLVALVMIFVLKTKVLSSMIYPFLIFVGLPILFLIMKRRSYVKQFEENFPKALQSVRGSLQAGHGIGLAFETLAKESAFPINVEFTQVLSEVALGKVFTDSLADLAKRIRNKDFNMFVIALSVQQESGGNLVYVLKNLEATIRARQSLQKEMSALTAQAKMGSYVLLGLPIGVFFIIKLVNPNYMDPFFEPGLGTQLLYGAIGMYGAGVLTILKITSVRIAS